MSKVQLQKDIRSNGGFILSDGTCNLQHLLPKAYDLIAGYKLRGTKCGIAGLKSSIVECFNFSDKQYRKDITGPNGFFYQQYKGRCGLVDYRHGDIQIDPSMVWDDTCNFLSSISPAGYYFGSSEGDGACIGWFKYDEEME